MENLPLLPHCLCMLYGFLFAVDMFRFMQMMEKETEMFCGIYWAYDRMDLLMMLKEKMPRYNYIVGTMTSMMGYMSMGIDAISMTAMNFMPEMMKVFTHLNRPIDENMKQLYHNTILSTN